MTKPFWTLQQHIDKVKIIHGDKIDVLSTKYTCRNDILEYHCNKCNKNFKKKADYIIQGYGCNACSPKRGQKPLNNIEYIFRLIGKYKGNIVNLESIKGRQTKIKHKCIKHGNFINTPDHLLRHNKGITGCPKCALEARSTIRMTEYKFQRRLKLKHNGFIKLVSPYINIQAVHTFQCDKEHQWRATADSVVRISGCPICCRASSYSKISLQWLSECEIYFDTKLMTRESNTKEVAFKFKGDKRPFRVDGYDPLTKTVYEFYGDYWHGNPKIFKSDTPMFGGLTAGDLYQRTLERERKLVSKGFKVISVWERDYKTYLKDPSLPFPYSTHRPKLLVGKANIEVRF